jgi:hypothetical protein
MTQSDGRWLTALIALGALCCVLAYSLRLAREETRAEVANVPVRSEQAKQSPAPTAATPEPTGQVKPPGGAIAVGQARKALWAAQRQMHADPKARAFLQAAEKAAVRFTHPQLASTLRLSFEEEESLLNVLAEQEVRQQEVWNSAAPPDFDFEAFQRSLEPERMAVLGAEKYGRYERYIESLPERHRVLAFRSQLGKHEDVQADTAERLIAALSTVRIEAERKAQEKPPSHDFRLSFADRYGVSVVVHGGEDGLQQATADLEASDRRMASAASAVLDAATLRRFSEFLEKRREATLAEVEEMLELNRPR